MGSSSVQFYGLDAILAAFQNNDVEAWSISQNKQFMFKGYGYDMLKALLIKMVENGSGAQYTLRVYEDIEDIKKIKESTPADGSFNFRLTEEREYIAGQTFQQRIGNNVQESKENAIMAKLESLEMQIKILKEGEESGSKLGVIGEILEHPAIAPVLPKIVEIIAGFLSGNKNNTQPIEQNILPQYVPQQRQAVLNGIDEEKIISEAIAQLKKHDANLPAHLQKLVQIAENEPATFQMFLNLLA